VPWLLEKRWLYQRELLPSRTTEISGGRVEATGGFMAGLEQPPSEEA
jgi:hypothetical protein